LPQLRQKKRFICNNATKGLKLILWGLLKKLEVADRLSIYVSTAFDNAEQHSGITLVVAPDYYVFQLHADFSGYTDMARGFAKILGFDIMENFKIPLL